MQLTREKSWIIFNNKARGTAEADQDLALFAGRVLEKYRCDRSLDLQILGQVLSVHSGPPNPEIFLPTLNHISDVSAQKYFADLVSALGKFSHVKLIN